MALALRNEQCLAEECRSLTIYNRVLGADETVVAVGAVQNAGCAGRGDPARGIHSASAFEAMLRAVVRSPGRACLITVGLQKNDPT